jgi:MoxR-like ATPase
MPDIDDVKSVAQAVLRHRLVLNFQAEADGVPAESLITFPSN